jgi:hypothetical protein
MTKSRRMRWAAHAAHMVVRNAYRILCKRPERGIHFENLGINERIILKWILGN